MFVEKDGIDAAAVQRGSDILDRIKSVFAEKGFDGASMQDLARAAGMSAGNFYRYFPSKEAIIIAMTCKDMDMIRDEFVTILAADDPMEAFRAALMQHIEQGAEDGALWVQIEAAAARRPDIAKQLAETEQMIVNHMLAVFAHLSGRPLEEITENYTAHARLIVMLVQELSVRSSGCGGFRPRDIDTALGELVIQTILNIVDEIITGKGSDAQTGPVARKA